MQAIYASIIFTLNKTFSNEKSFINLSSGCINTRRKALAKCNHFRKTHIVSMLFLENEIEKFSFVK